MKQNFMTRIYILLILIINLLYSSIAGADYINLTGVQLSSTIAEYYVDDDGSGNDKFAMDVWMQNPFIGFNFHF